MSDLSSFQGTYLDMLRLERLPDPETQSEVSHLVTRHVSDAGLQPFLYLVFLRDECVSLKETRALVRDEQRRARDLGRVFQWKLASFPRSPELGRVLEEEGFTVSRVSELLYFPMDRTPTEMVSSPVTVTVAREASDFDALHALAERVSGPGPRTLATILLREVSQVEPLTHVYIAWAGDEAVSAGWLKVYGKLGYLFGGMTHPDFRGRGAYRALVEMRIAHARRLGLRFLATDANENSAPILKRMGFQSAGAITTYTMK